MAIAAAAALAQLLRAVRYPEQLLQSEAASGSPAPLLPALGWLLCRFSKHIAALVAEQGLQVGAACIAGMVGQTRHAELGEPSYSCLTPLSFVQLAGASDLRFVEGLLKFVREGLGLRPALSAAQFLSQVGGMGVPARVCMPFNF